MSHFTDNMYFWPPRGLLYKPFHKAKQGGTESVTNKEQLLGTPYLPNVVSSAVAMSAGVRRLLHMWQVGSQTIDERLGSL